MKKAAIGICLFLSIALLSGCGMRTVDKMYCLPERSEDYNSLQSVITDAMAGLEYCAPISGENQQLVQMADLTGDGKQECVLFAKGGENRPLHILVFAQKQEKYIHTETIDLAGTAFDRVEFAQIDGKPGLELVVGTQVSDSVSRAVCVFSFSDTEAQQLMSADYVQYLTVDLDSNGKSEIFVLHAGPTEADRGIAELYSVRSETMERSVEVNMSQPVNSLKRILQGRLYGGQQAVYVASAVDEDTLVTDVFALVDGAFTNVSFSKESGTSVQTMRNYFVYADDMDSDGVMELPSLLPMRSIDTARFDSDHNLIRWYSIAPDGTAIHKMHTYHNFLGGWYLDIDDSQTRAVSVIEIGNTCDFYFWDEDTPIRVLTIHNLTGQSREEQSTADGRFVLHKGDATIYAASLHKKADQFGITRETVIRSFHLIHEHWNSGKT